MGSPVRPEPVDPVAAYLAAKQAPDPVSDYLSAKSSAGPVSHGAGRDFGDEPNFGATMLDAVPFATKGKAALDAGLFGGSYDQRLANARLGIQQYQKDNPKTALAASLLGGAIPALATLGGSAEGQIAAKVPLLARIFRGAVAGAGLGGLQGASQAQGNFSDYAHAIEHQGTAGAILGAATPLVTSTLGAGARAIGLPDKAAGVVSNVADALGTNGKPNRFLSRLASTLGTQGQAATEVARRAEMDAGAAPNVPSAPNLPSLALDAGGPNLQGLAENIAKRPGPGQTILRNAVQGRQGQMRDYVNKALDQGTGTTAQSGEALLQQLADEHANIDNTSRIVEEAGFPRAPNENPLQAWRAQMGGTLSNGISALRQLVADKSATAKQVFGEARTATQGVAIDSPTLDAVRQSPAGSLAYDWALAQKANRMSPLATAQAVNPSAQNALLALGVPADKAAVGALETKELPDPETLHFMKQRLAKMARLGFNDGQGGTLATQAQGALALWGKVKGELPDVWQKADDATAAKFRLIDANNAGRDLIRTQLNPKGTKALYTSMDAVEQNVQGMHPDEQHAFRVGAQSAFTDYLRSGAVSAKTLASQLQEPTSAMARRLALATGDANAPQRLAQSLGLAYQGQAAPLVPVLSSEARAAGLGLDVLRHGVTAPSNAPSRSLGILARSKAAMGPGEQAALQAGAAQSLRGEFAGSTVASPGRVFGANPERAAQTSFAFPSSTDAARFQQTVSGWDAAQSQTARLTGGSPTFPLATEEANRQSGAATGVLRNLVRGNLGSAATSLAGEAIGISSQANRQKLDATIAQLLTNPDRSALDEARLSALLRQRIGTTANRLLPRLAATEATSEHQF